MTVYIAVCDDNIADRKHTERLLEREKDARLKESGDVLYIESFGSSDSMLKTPVKYDMFIIDMNTPSENGMDIARLLRKTGIIAPIALLSSVTDYSSFGVYPPNTTVINKELLNQGKISHIFEIAKEWAATKPPLLEIRGKKDTIFIPHEELIRAAQKTQFVEVVTSGGDLINVPGTMKSFLNIVAAYNCFVMCKKALVNIHHIKSIEGNSLVLSNGEKWAFSPYKTHAILEQFISFTSSETCGKKQ